MLVRKNYYVYAENSEMQRGKKKLLGSVRFTQNGDQWAMEIQWKDEREAETLVTKAEEGELQLQIREKEIILGQEREKREFVQKKEQEKEISGNTGECREKEWNENVWKNGAKELSENTEEGTEESIEESIEENIEENIEKEAENVENAVNTNKDKIEKQELPVTATEGEREEDKQEQQGKRQSQTAREDMRNQADQEWELVRRSCHKVEACRELGEVYRVNKGEFAVLPESIKHILQNSFLVHGLMNYGYLLLFRADEKMKQFGVGVPGVYYEKEKLVAEMFGFPQFWCDGKSNSGKFGYYLRIVP